MFIGPIMETLGYKQLLWDGHGLDDDVPHQFLDGGQGGNTLSIVVELSGEGSLQDSTRRQEAPR